MDNPRATATAPTGCLDNDGVANLMRQFHVILRLITKRPIGARNTWDACFAHGSDRRNFIPHQTYRFGARTDEHEAAWFHAFGKIGIFGQKAITGMNGNGISDFGGTDDGGDVKVTFRRRWRTDTYRFIRETDMVKIAICRRMCGNSLNTEFPARPQ